MKTQEILEALDTDEKVIALAKALHKNKACFSIVLNGKPVAFDDVTDPGIDGDPINPDPTHPHKP